MPTWGMGPFTDREDTHFSSLNASSQGNYPAEAGKFALSPSSALFSGSQIISTQAFPKLILHLSAEAVDRKILVRQENTGKLHPIGKEEWGFFVLF